ncbi:S8 family serine peptidase [Halorarum salinum]|uniref:S8 family serine peptidase n=1 Tax=Halorarum salinum TaxID=2743089 RepID=A0A7D5QHH3_9EURY|nr:S8 family serine peptidase [Halobaculum salinum]QLG62903.1 S8 family serine peptidase [Halobaculum salinum]
MTDEPRRRYDRRTVLKAGGALGATAALPLAADTARAAGTVDDRLDLSASDALHEVIVVFADDESVARLSGDLDLREGIYEYRMLSMAYTALTSGQVRTVAGWDGVRRVRKAVELEYYDDDARGLVGVDAASDLGYDGSGVDVAVIDSGFSGPHPDFEGRIESNWQWVDDPLGSPDADWVDLGADADTDDLGHGTHVSGTIAGDGGASDGRYRGMAPGARLSVYSTNATQYLPYVVGAWDHVLARADDPDVDFDPDVVSNSYGVARDVRYNPDDPVNVATWEAYRRGMVVAFAAGNDGPAVDTLNRFAKAPHVLCVAATDDDREVTEFSSRGRTPDEDRETNYDRRTALGNLGRFHAAMTNEERTLDSGTWDGELGPSGTGSDYHAWEAPNGADVLALTLDLTPDGEQITVTVHEGSRDGTEVGKMGEEPVYQHYTLTTDVTGGETYWIELEPAANVAVTYEIDYEGFEQIRGEPEQFRPVGVYRPAVGTPGNSLVSTVGPTDPLDALEPDEEPYYTPMTGTSMATPVTAGVATLLIDAARMNGREWSPVDVINVLEATAEAVHGSYTPWNVGAGFVNAEAAVRRAERGEFADFDEVELTDTES